MPGIIDNPICAVNPHADIFLRRNARMPRRPNPVDANTFGGRVRYWRIQRGMYRQGDLAKAAGLSQSSISDIESGNTRGENISASVLEALTKALKVQPEELTKGKITSRPVGVSGAEREAADLIRQLAPEDAEIALQQLRAFVKMALRGSKRPA